jgi:hypothetical protein
MSDQYATFTGRNTTAYPVKSDASAHHDYVCWFDLLGCPSHYTGVDYVLNELKFLAGPGLESGRHISPIIMWPPCDTVDQHPRGGTTTELRIASAAS